ncbi:MAG: SAM-dependent DNA methyltransferase [Cellulomonas sp.]|nr:DNA methyltransferase [Cellulomonas sp.]MCR6648530.1 SAM-dependent DNA methyltransferase [Cellulomonas sp.]
MIRRRNPKRPSELHRDWLELVDTDGPFISVPTLKAVWPQGMPQLPDSARAAVRDAGPAFERAWDAWDKKRDDEAGLTAYRVERDSWVDIVLRQAAGWGAYLVWDGTQIPGGPASTSSPNQAVTVEATGALVAQGAVGAWVLVVDPVSDLRDPLDEEWSASPVDRMESLLRDSGVPIGIVTDGRWWGLVCAREGAMVASGIIDAQRWVDEPDARNAFFALVSLRQLVGGAPEERLPELFKNSVAAAEEITVALGTQVRRAVELLVSAFSEAAEDARRAGRPDPLPTDRNLVYEGAVTMMMRTVFLLFAEERSLLPQGVLFTNGYGISQELDELVARSVEEGAEALDGTHLTWHRLLATSQALYAGVAFEDMRLPAYGGSLFDARRFPFLTTRNEHGGLAVTVSDRVMLEVLRAVQVAQLKGQPARRISFRDVDVEQIGYIYEGLLGYTCDDVDTVIIGLIGAAGQEPEIPLDVLDDLAEGNDDDARFVSAVLDWVKRNQPAATPVSASRLRKDLVGGDTLEDAERALLAVTRDEALLARLRPYVGIIRRDLRDRPVVVQPGGLVVVETPSRATSGAHYTPKSLAQEVVLHALKPLVFQPGPHQTSDQSQWRRLSSDRILDLKVVDIACGSGAFLVAAAEYLAGVLVEAWHAEGVALGSAHDMEVRAKRQVVASCLYGADINGMAIEMCKLSLWLVSLDPDLPFSFVDDKVLHGNSLLGVTDVRQLEALHIDPSAVKDTLASRHAGTLFGAGDGIGYVEALDVRGVLRRAVDLRRRLATEVDENDPQRSAVTKRRLWAEYQELTSTLSAVADGVIAAGLAEGGKPGRKLNERYEDLRIAVDRAFAAGGANDRSMLAAIVESGLRPEVETDYERWLPLHWALAVPDVMERGGFDAVIGNPPFLGGQKLTGAMGTNVRDWFVCVLAGGTRGSADLVAYFFLRALSLLTPAGTIGLIATNTIAQGDTREVGLDRMAAAGFTITRAVQSRPWPAESANLEYAAVWGGRGPIGAGAKRVSDDREVRGISTLLEPVGRVEGVPVRLAENSGIVYVGCYVLGMGFVLEPEEAREWIEEDPRNAEVLFPYVNGEDLNQRPDGTGSRWVIDFYDRSLDAASSYAIPMARLRHRVYDERQKVNRKALRERWWQYAEKRPGMRRAIADLDEVLAIARVSRTVMPMRLKTGSVLSEATVVFATDSYADQAVLSSSVHQMWAIKYSSGMRSDPRYTPSDVFETLARPGETGALSAIGATLDVERREIMLRRALGVTKLYNLVNDPEVSGVGDRDVARLREVHVELDHTVMAAYGWSDVALDHGFHAYRKMERWTVSPVARVEILDRLLEENHRRAALQGDAPLPPVDDEDGDDE